MRIAILGGGMTGTVLAAHAIKGAEAVIFERQTMLGGLHQSPMLNGYPYDVGAFFFGEGHAAFSTFPGLSELFVPFAAQLRSIGDGGSQDIYPVTARGYLRNNGIKHLTIALADLLSAKWRFRKRDSLPAFCRYYLGDRIYQRSGLRGYIERLYGLPEAEIDISFAAERMMALSNLAGIRRTIRNRATLTTPPAAAYRLLARPRDGFQKMYDFIESDLVRRGVEVRKNTTVDGIARSNRGYLLRSGNSEEWFDHVVSTAPIPATARMIGLDHIYRFPTMSLLTIFYRFRGNPGFDAATLSNFSAGGNWKRITDFSKAYGLDSGAHPLAIEITIPSPDCDVEAERNHFENHAKSLGLLVDGALTFQGHHCSPNAYPVYLKEGAEQVEADKQRIKDWGVILAGRQGQFGFGNSDRNARHAIEVANKLTQLSIGDS